MRIFILTVFATLALAAPAGAVTLVNADGSVAEPYESWANMSRVPVTSTPVHVVTETTSCGRATLPPACVELAPRVMHLEDRRCGSPDSASGWNYCRFLVMHELGHLFDYEMPEWKRTRFLSIVKTTATWDEPFHYDQSPREIFATLYAICSMNDKLSTWSKRTIRRTCHLIRIPNTA